MSEKNSALESGFDWLSRIPYVKTVMYNMWVFSTACSGFSLIVQFIQYKKGDLENGWELLRNFGQWLFFNAIWSLIFHLWTKRDKEREKITNNLDSK